LRYLITGGAGFIGSALARMLAAKLTYAADIRALDPVKEAIKQKVTS
jgi:nucleoside-diphosphate-sugar epimerase